MYRPINNQNFHYTFLYIPNLSYNAISCDPKNLLVRNKIAQL